MSRLLRMAALSAVVALGLGVSGSNAFAQGGVYFPGSSGSITRYSYSAGPSAYHPRSLYGRSSIGFSYVSPGLSVYAGPSVGLYSGYGYSGYAPYGYSGYTPGFYPRPYGYGYDYHHGHHGHHYGHHGHHGHHGHGHHGHGHHD